MFDIYNFYEDSNLYINNKEMRDTNPFEDYTNIFSTNMGKTNFNSSLFNFYLYNTFDKDNNNNISFDNNFESFYGSKCEKNEHNPQYNKKVSKIKFISQKENLEKNLFLKKEYIYRKDAYYKHFKSIFSKYVRNKANILKNICFPYYHKNNFSSLSYKYTGNPKEKDNFSFLSLKIKDLLTFGKDPKIKNRQYNNEILIKFIEKNEEKVKDKITYKILIHFINDSVENEIMHFYENKEEIVKLNNDSLCLFYDKYLKYETGISLLEKNGFIKILRKKISMK